MLSDESSSDSETGRFKGQAKSHDEKSNISNSKRDLYSRSAGRNRRSDERCHREIERRREDRDKFERPSRERSRYSRYSPVRRKYSRERSRERSKRSTDRYRDRYTRDPRTREEISKPREIRSNSKEKHRRSGSRSHKSPVKETRNIKDEIKAIITRRDRSSDKAERKSKIDKSISPEPVLKKSIVLKPTTETLRKKSESPIVIEEHVCSDVSDEVQPGSYYNMIPTIIKEKSEESTEIDSSDDERLRAKLLNLEKELQKTKKKKHKKKHKRRRSSKSDKDKHDSSASVEVSSTTDIQEVVTKSSQTIETNEVTSTQKSNQKESSEEGEILSDDSQSDIDPNDLRHKLKRSKTTQDAMKKQNVWGPALPPHLEQSASSVTEGPLLPPHLQNKVHNIGPSIPEDMRKVLAENSEMINEVVHADSSDDDGIGPLPTGAENKWSEAHQRLEERAIEMKIKTLDGYSLKNSNVKSREQWMLELPEGKAKYLGLEARSFRPKEGPDMSDRSSWTDTPEDKARKALGIPKEEDSSAVLQSEARERQIANRDEEQEKAAKKHKKKHKRDESLLEIHQKKLKKKKKKEDKDEEKKERRPFSRDEDLQVNRFDEAQKKSIIKKAQSLNTRFSRGEAKYL